MGRICGLVLPLVLVLACSSSCWAEEGVLGLNGFVQVNDELAVLKQKGEAGPDLSKVVVELYTKGGGIRKYHADCAPNGFFFIPVYETGTFIAKVKGPGGWSVVPEKTTVECKDDGCAKGEDIIFKVVGFSVKGKIVGAGVEGCDEAPSNFNSVTVTLSSKGGQSRSVAVKATANGQFTFSKVLPGDYQLAATHPSWTLGGTKSKIPVSVGWKGVDVEESFKIKGYQLTGRVEWKGQSVENVEIVLYLDADVSINCEKPNQDFFHDKSLGSAKCRTVTDNDGGFAFSSIPCGKYNLVARYSTPEADFHVSPAFLPVSVGHGNTQLGTVFTVTGFSLSGKVVHPANGQGVAGAQVRLSGKDVGKTDTQGKYTLAHLEEGTFVIEAEKENLKFEKIESLKVAPGLTQIPDIQVSQYSICGSISVTSKQFKAQKTVTLKSPDSSKVIEQTTSDASGKFCLWAKPGKYNVQPEISAEEKSKGLILGPRTREVHIVDAPITKIQFVEKRLNLKAEVKKSSKETAWGDIVLELSGPDFAPVKASLNPSAGVKLSEAGDKSLEASFQDLVPGTYTLKVRRSGWCWSEEAITVTLDTKDQNAKPFVQKGHTMKMMLSHTANLKFSGPGLTPDMSKEYEGGVDHGLCFTSTGMHTVIPSGCVSFEKDAYEFAPAEMGTLSIVATHFLAKGVIRLASTSTPTAPVSVSITSKKTGKSYKAKTTEYEKGVLSYSVKGVSGDTLKIEPKHSSLLFFPESFQMVNSGTGCQPDAKPFSAKPGLFLKAITDPPVQGVSVSLIDTKETELEKKVTDESGKVEFGPLRHQMSDYSLKLKKVGYEFDEGKPKGPDSLVYVAKQLAKVEVQVDVPGKDKEGVLVVLTGGKRYRSNAQTDSKGMVTFWDLPPATYYLKPVLKEYEFQPALTEVVVEDGKDELVKFQATRTAFSVSGIVQGFPDEAIGGITIEAVGPDDLYESAVSSSDGAYRLRGLKPGFEYLIRVAPVDGVERGWPASYQVTLAKSSVTDKGFTVFMLPEVRRVTGVLKIDSDLVNQTSIEILKVSKAGDKPQLVSTAALDITQWFDFGVPTGSYLLKPTSKSLKATHTCSFQEVPVHVGPSGPSEVHVGEIEVECKERDHAGESEGGNRWPVILAILAVIGMQWRQKIQGLLSGG